MWVPFTFSANHSGPVHTWTHTTGSRSRIDYFVTGFGIPRHAIQTQVLTDFELLTPNPDHDAVEARVSFRMIVWGRLPPRLRRSQNLDVRKLADPGVRENFERALDASGMHEIPWDVDVNTHALWVQQAINWSLQQVLPQRSEVPRSPYITNEVWELRKAKILFKRKTAVRKKNFLPTVLSAVMRVWKGFRHEWQDGPLGHLRKTIVLSEMCAGAVQMATFRMKTWNSGQED